MNQAFCHFCQMFFETVHQHCWQCSSPAEILGPVKPKNEQDSIADSAPPTNENEFAANEKTASANEESPKYTPLPPPRSYQRQTSGSAGENYSSYQNLSDEKPDVFRLLKPGLLCVAILVGVGFLCSYTKAYFAAMPGQRVDEIMDAKYNAGKPPEKTPEKPQETWFWSFFRSEPTAEEIFEHFEDVTEATDKNLLYKTMVLSGSVNFSVQDAEPEKCYRQMQSAAYAENNSCFTFMPSYINTGAKPGPWDFDTNFEMSLKSPNKIVIAGTMTPKDARLQGVKLSFWTGTDGEKKWRVNKTVIRGEKFSDEKENDESLPSIFSNDTDLLSSTFVKDFYEKAEYIGKEDIAGRKHYAVKGTKKSGQADMLYFDMETGLVSKFLSRNGEVYILKYSTIDGVKVPSKTLFKDGNGLIMMTISGIKTDVELNDSIFQQSSY